jgi:hypothetical protein
MTERHPEAHHAVLSYLRGRFRGGPRDEVYEAKSLTDDLSFDTLNLVELLYVLATDRGIDSKTFSDAISTSNVKIPGAEDYDDDHEGWASLAALYQRVVILAGAAMPEPVRDTLLAAGVVGPGTEVRPFHPQVTVGFLVKYCRALGL